VSPRPKLPKRQFSQGSLAAYSPKEPYNDVASSGFSIPQQIYIQQNYFAVNK
jgi:hypothetical protein